MSQRKIRIAALLLLVAVVLTSGACIAAPTATPALAPTPVPAATPPTQTPLPPPPAATPAPTPGPIKITDAAGQTLELKQPPERLVLVGRGPYMALHLLYMFPTAWDKLVGLEKKGTTADDFLPFVDPKWDQKTVLASGPNAEQIAALKPDLVLMKGIVPDALSKALAQVNIPTLYINLETPDAFYQDVTNLGLVLGAESRAQEIITYYKGKLDRIQQRIAGLTESEKPRALLLEYTDRGGSLAVNVPAKAWMQTLQVQSAGGNPVWLEAAAVTDGWTVTNLEQIALWNPDKIFLVISYTLNPIEVIDTLKADPMWTQLKAVKDNETYAFPSDLYGWDSPEPRWILGVTWLATRMYPDKFADIDMNDEIREFFTTFYGMDKATVDREIVTRAHMDVH
jgi:iron complex transport system substrate-binding protein